MAFMASAALSNVFSIIHSFSMRRFLPDCLSIGADDGDNGRFLADCSSIDDDGNDDADVDGFGDDDSARDE